MLRWLVVPVLGGAFAVAALAAPTHGDEPATWVATREIASGAYELTLPVKVGVLEASERRELAFQVQGRLAFLADEGASVAAGDTLASLDTELSKVRLRQAEIRLAEARSEAARVRGLRSSNATSAKLLESAETALALRVADLAAAKEELAQRSLNAPFDGVVAETHVEVGEVVAPGRSVGVVLQRTVLEVEVLVPGAQVARIADGATARLEVPALGDDAIEGVVDRVAEAAREGGHLFPVTVLVPNEARRMRPGMTARVRIVTDSLATAAAAPLASVVERGGRRWVFFVVDGRARGVAVDDVPIDGDRLVLTGSLPSAELVVRGQRDLREGMRVRVDDTVLGGRDDVTLRPEVRGPRP